MGLLTGKTCTFIFLKKNHFLGGEPGWELLKPRTLPKKNGGAFLYKK